MIRRILPSKIAMGTHALEVIRFRKRYYTIRHLYDGYFEGVGAKIVASIPTDPKEYQSTLLKNDPWVIVC